MLRCPYNMYQCNLWHYFLGGWPVGGVVKSLDILLFVLRLNVPLNNFSVMSGRSQHFLGSTSTVGS